MASTSQFQRKVFTKDDFAIGDVVMLGKDTGVPQPHHDQLAVIIALHARHCDVFLQCKRQRQHVTLAVNYSSIAGVDRFRALVGLLGNLGHSADGEAKCSRRAAPVTLEVATLSREEQASAVERAQQNVLAATAAAREAAKLLAQRERSSVMAEGKARSAGCWSCFDGFWRLLRGA